MTTLRITQGLPARLIRAASNVLSTAHGADRLCVLSYHRILPKPDPLLDGEPTVDTFRWQMRLLARYFNVLPLAEAMSLLSAGGLPPRAVCITFDDGYRSTHDLALPVLNEFGLSATVFVSTAYLEPGTMWNEAIVDAVRRLPEGELDLSGLGIGIGTRRLRTEEERAQLLTDLTVHAKYLPPAQRNALTEHLAAMVGGGAADDLMLTPEMIRTMAAQCFEIGAHTVSHPILTSLSDDAARHEITQCKRDLETILDSPVRYFAYPNGKAGKDFDERHMEMVRAAGFKAAFSTEMGPAVRGQNVYKLPRSRPWDKHPFLFGLRLLRWLAQE